MPELPEVETTRRGLAPVIGHRIASLTVYDSRLRWPVPADLPKLVRNRTIDGIDRRSKYLLFRLGPDTVLMHFGMTGSLRVYRNPPPRRPHDHVDIRLDDGTVLRYHDPRRFGAVLWMPASARTHKLLAHLGPEPLDREFDAASLWKTLRKRSVPIKLALMDARVVVGVGNIYANEALFEARIRPATPACKVSRARLEALVAAVRKVLREAIDSGGSTLRDYVDAGGRPGEAQLRHFVYGREGQPCRVCGTTIKSQRQGGRATFYCPSCQR